MSQHALNNFNSANTEPSVHDEKLLGVDAVKIWHCHFGRNAWHSTWVRTFLDGCMHITRDAAEAYGETLRNFGNVIYIEELPALRLSGRRHSLIVTQLNTDTPLRGYSPQTPRQVAADCERGNLFTFGAPFGSIAHSFDQLSLFWRKMPLRSEHVLILCLKQGAEMQLLSPKEKLCAWKSISWGPRYLLGWRQIRYSMQKADTLKLARRANFSHTHLPKCASANVPTGEAIRI